MISNTLLFLIFLWILCSHLELSSARTLDSVRVFIVEEDAYNYLQNYLHQYDMNSKKRKNDGSNGNLMAASSSFSPFEDEEKRVAIIMGIRKKKKVYNKKDTDGELPAPIKGFYETDRRLDEEQLTEPSAQYVMPPPDFQVHQQQVSYHHQQPLQSDHSLAVEDEMEELASSLSPYSFLDYDDSIGLSDTGYNYLEMQPPMSPPLIQYRQSYFPAREVMYHLFKKK